MMTVQKTIFVDFRIVAFYLKVCFVVSKVNISKMIVKIDKYDINQLDILVR